MTGITWEPLDDQPLRVPAARMETGSYVGVTAFGVRFRNPAAPQAVLTAWTFSEAYGGGGFSLSRRWDYSVIAGQTAKASIEVLAPHPDREGWWPTAEEADKGALGEATTLAAVQVGDAFRASGGFDWDGEPWSIP